MAKRYAYVTPNGDRIIGSLDICECRADILCFDENGEPEFDGNTEMFYDSQRTQQREKEDLYLDEDGGEWTLAECTRVECDEDGEPCA